MNRGTAPHRSVTSLVQAFLMLALCLCVMLVAAAPAFAEEGESDRQTVRTTSLELQRQLFWVDEASGVHSGYGYKFLTDIGDLEGWDWSYTACGWSESMDMLLAGQIDVMSDVSYTDQRAQQMLFSELPMGNESYYLFVGPNSTVSQASELNGATIGVARDSIVVPALEQYLQSTGMSCDIYLYDSEGHIDDLLSSGTIDAFASVNILADDGYLPLARIGGSDYYFAINKDRPDIKEGIDRAMRELLNQDPYYVLDLSKKYINNSRVLKTLSAEQAKWLAAQGTLRFGYMANHMPYSGTDENGNVTGLLSSIVNIFMKNYGATVECVPYSNSDDLAQDVRTGVLDAAFRLTDNEWIADSNGLALCNPFLHESSVMMYLGNYEDCLNGKIAISTANGFDLPCFKSSLPNAELVVYGTAQECLDAVLSHKVDGYVGHSSELFYIQNGTSKYRSLKYSGVNDDSTFGFVVSKSNPMLYGILNRLNGCYTDVQISNIMTSYVVQTNTFSLADFVQANAVQVTLAGILLCLVVAGAISFAVGKNRRLKGISCTDALTGLGNRNAYEARKDSLADKPANSLGIVFADVNGLKECNDTEGHKEGDDLIRKAARYLSDCFSKDNVYRIGGDEFVVVSPDCSQEDFARAFARLAQLGGEMNGGILSVGMSWSPAGYDLSTLLYDAEREMYEMKRRHYEQGASDRRCARG